MRLLKVPQCPAAAAVVVVVQVAKWGFVMAVGVVFAMLAPEVEVEQLEGIPSAGQLEWLRCYWGAAH